MSRIVAGIVSADVVFREGRLDPEHFLGSEADQDVQSARESLRRARRRVSLAEERLALALKARVVSQALVDSGEVSLFEEKT